MTADGWTADNTKGSFLGMTASWIEVEENPVSWKLRSEVVGFQPVSGDHSGWNLGRYVVGLCDRVGIFNKKGSKVRQLCLSIDNRWPVADSPSFSPRPSTTPQTTTQHARPLKPSTREGDTTPGKQKKTSFRASLFQF
jgi:hypothetical protein